MYCPFLSIMAIINQSFIMIDRLLAFIERHDLLILSTHDPADADGLGSQMVLACVLRWKGKNFRIINASAIPKHFRSIDPLGLVEQWDDDRHGNLPEQAGFILMDTADEVNTGKMKDVFYRAKEVFVIDHHEPKPVAAFQGIADPSAASTCEMVVEIAHAIGAVIDPQTALSAYIGIAHDSGFFAYPKTGPKTLRSALILLECGVNPTDVYRQLYENTSTEALLLQQKALSSLTLYCGNRVAVQLLRMEDFTETCAAHDETDGFVNFPLKSKDVLVSLLLKESPEGKVRCSLRSKGAINVAKIAQDLGGGGHVNASGFKSDLNIEQTVEQAIKAITKILDIP